MHLAQWLGVLGDQRGDASGLGPGEVLADNPPRGEPDRVLVVDDLRRLAEGHGVEPGLAIGMEELPALEQARGTGVAHLGDRPEQPHLVFDPLPCRAPVVGRATG